MPQKKYIAEGLARPPDLSQAQLKRLAAGGAFEGSLEPHSGPPDLSEADIKALAEGKEVDLEKLDQIGLSGGRGEHEAPPDLTERDIKALREGKEIDLEKRRKKPKSRDA